FSDGHSRVFSLQRYRHAKSFKCSTSLVDEALATLRIFRSLSADAGGIAVHASSSSDDERGWSPANSVLDAGSISVRATRLPRLYVGSGRRGAGSLHVAGRPAGD